MRQINLQTAWLDADLIAPPGNLMPDKRLRWTEERTAKLTELYLNGCSMGGISKQMGISRNAVIGKVHRLGLPLRGAPLSAKQQKARRDRVTTPRIVRRQQLNTFVLREQSLGPEPTMLPVELICEPVSLVDLQAHQCRFPVSAEGEPFMFCGADKYGDHSYCIRHCHICYRRAA